MPFFIRFIFIIIIVCNKFVLSRKNSIINNLFYTQIINIFNCECGLETYSFQKILDIPLLIHNNKKGLKLQYLIKKFLKETKVNLKELYKNWKKEKINMSKKRKDSEIGRKIFARKIFSGTIFI